MKSVALHNLGCKVNSYEIEVMQQMLQAYYCKVGYEEGNENKEKDRSDRKSTRLNSSHPPESRMPSSA